MFVNKLLLSFLVVSLFLFSGLSQQAISKTLPDVSLVIVAEDDPPGDEITKMYKSNLLQELTFGRMVSYELLNKFGNKVNTDPELNNYVNLVGQSIAKSTSKRPQIKYRFGIIDTDEINAFACPGGYIFVTTGLLKVLYDENELAAVLAHEIGHIEHGDGLRDIQTSKAPEYADFSWKEVESKYSYINDVATSLPYAGWYASYYSPKNIAKREINKQIGKVGGGYGGYIGRSVAYNASDAAVDLGFMALKEGVKRAFKGFAMRNYYDPLTPEVEFAADAYSAEALAKMGYDPKGIASFLKTMEHIKSSQSESATSGTQGASEGSSNVFTYRHPPAGERIDMVNVIVDSGDMVVKNPNAGSDEYFETRYVDSIKALK